MNELSLAAATWLWDYYLLATALLAAVLAASALVRQPARRRAIAWSTVLGLFALALLCAWPQWARFHLLAASASSIPAITPQAESFASEPPQMATSWAGTLEAAIAIQPEESPLLLPEPPVVARVDYESIALTGFLAGSGLIVVWQLFGFWQVRRLCASASRPPERVAELLRTLADPATAAPALGVVDLPVPVAVGLRRPVILLPAKLAAGASHDELRTVLAHELAHVRNRDLWQLAALRLLLVVLWAHPLFWLLRRRVRLDQELLADAAAAEASTRHNYAEQLVRLARSTATMRPPRLASSVGLWEGPSQLKQRITILLDEKLAVWRSCSLRWLAASGTLVALATLVISLVTLKPASVAVAEAPAEKPATAEQPDPTPTIDEKPKVRIVAIGTNGEQPVQWWSEKGEPIDQPALALKPLDSVSPTPNRQLIFAVEGLPDDAGVHWYTIPSSNTGSNSVTSGDPEDRAKYYSHAFDVKDDIKSFDLRVGIASGAWLTLVSGLNSSHGLPGGSAIFSGAYVDDRDRTFVIISHSFKDADIQVLGIDKSGKEHVAAVSTGYGAGSLNQTKWVFADMKPADLKTCRLQSRPYEWIEFNGLPSEPRDDADSRKVDKPWSVHGRVTDADGRGLPRVTVRAATGDGTLIGGGKTETDENGQYRLHFGPGMRMMISDYAPMGVGVQAATISASKPGWFEANLSRQGNLLMTDLTPETIGDSAKDWGHKSLDSVVFSNQPKEVNFIMKPAAVIEGVLEESSRGWEVEDQYISIDGPELPPSSSALTSFTTGRDGNFVVDNLPTGFDWRFGMRIANTAVDLQTDSFRLEEPGRYRCRLVMEVNERNGDAVAMQLRIAEMVRAVEQSNMPPAETGIDAHLPGQLLLVADLEEKRTSLGAFPYAVISVNPNSGDWTKLVDVPPGAGSPEFSRDGQHSFFQYFNKDRRGVFMVDTDGNSRPKHVSDHSGQISCDPLGNELIVSSPDLSALEKPIKEKQSNENEENENIDSYTLMAVSRQPGHWRINLDESTEEQLDIPTDYRIDDWSPDGKWLAATSWLADQAATGDIYLMRPDGSDRRKLTAHGHGCSWPRFSSDGKYVAYCFSGKRGELLYSSVRIVDVSTQADSELIGHGNVLKDGKPSGPYRWYHFPTWSPDGNWLAIAFDRQDANSMANRRQGVLLISRDGSQRKELELQSGADFGDFTQRPFWAHGKKPPIDHILTPPADSKPLRR